MRVKPLRGPLKRYDADELQKALKEGKTAAIQINLNGQNIGPYGDGSTANVNMPGGGFGYDTNGFEFDGIY